MADGSGSGAPVGVAPDRPFVEAWMMRGRGTITPAGVGRTATAAVGSGVVVERGSALVPHAQSNAAPSAGIKTARMFTSVSYSGVPKSWVQ